jgi:predicted MPP superfamily phosphohydrolase
MLAGHTHGGQIQFPFFGAVLAPSIFGTRYASGLFYEAPTLLHVSRGVSGLTPVRYNCRPEIALLRLVGSNTAPRRNDATPDAEEAMATGS